MKSEEYSVIAGFQTAAAGRREKEDTDNGMKVMGWAGDREQPQMQK